MELQENRQRRREGTQMQRAFNVLPLMVPGLLYALYIPRVNWSIGLWGYGGMGRWGIGALERGGIGVSVLGDVCHYLICHCCFVAESQYDAKCPCFLGLWGS